MGALSNFLRRGSPGSGGLEVRWARREEIEAGVRIILAPPTPNYEPQVREFIRLAQHSAKPGGLWVAVRGKRVESAILVLVSPGKTMLLFTPPKDDLADATRQIVEAVCRDATDSGITLAQALADVQDDPAQAILNSCGFVKLADLLYMQTVVRPALPEPELPASMSWKTFSESNRSLFAQTILTSYESSLDCPALNGLRRIDDVIAGHQATGVFNPRLWMILCENQIPQAVMLLSPVAHGPSQGAADAMELVYSGLVPSARGKGVGDLMMKHALAVTAQWPCGKFSLAVDAGNTPALKLYWRHGLQSVGRKTALMKKLP